MAYENFAYVYDRLMEDMPYGEWLDFAEDCFKALGLTRKPETLADLGCGTGSLAIPLAKKGYRVIGIDLSETMLSVASLKEQEALREAALCGSIQWLQQDMRQWDPGEPVDAVLSFCDSINYLLEEEELLDTFRCTWEALKPGGCFLFDLHHPEQFVRYAEEQPFFLNEDDIAYIWTSGLDGERMEIEHRLSIFAKPEETDSEVELYRRIEEVHVQRAYPPETVVRLLEQAGFTRDGIRVYADFQLEPPEEHTERLFFAAVK